MRRFVLSLLRFIISLVLTRCSRTRHRLFSSTHSSSWSIPDTYVTHNAPGPLTVKSEIGVCFASTLEDIYQTLCSSLWKDYRLYTAFKIPPYKSSSYRPGLHLSPLVFVLHVWLWVDPCQLLFCWGGVSPLLHLRAACKDTASYLTGHFRFIITCDDLWRVSNTHQSDRWHPGTRRSLVGRQHCENTLFCSQNVTSVKASCSSCSISSKRTYNASSLHQYIIIVSMH